MSELLVKLGWTQAHFARVAGVSERTVGVWVKGDPPQLAMRYLELCARLLNV